MQFDSWVISHIRQPSIKSRYKTFLKEDVVVVFVFRVFVWFFFERGRQAKRTGHRHTRRDRTPPPDYALTFAHFSFNNEWKPPMGQHSTIDWVALASNRGTKSLCSLCLCVISVCVWTRQALLRNIRTQTGSDRIIPALFLSWTIWRSRKNKKQKKSFYFFLGRQGGESTV